MRIAALDLGSNSFHLLVADVHPDGTFEALTREKEMLRLGDEVTRHGCIRPAMVERAVATVRHLCRVADADGAHEVIAKATSAIRTAANGSEVVDRIEADTGVHVEVISGAEEARLVFSAVRASVVLDPGPAVCFDLGGGSVEVMVGDATGLAYAASEPLGVGRLTAAHVAHDPLTKQERRALEEHLRAGLAPIADAVGRLHPRMGVGSSGTLNDLAAMVVAHRTGALPATTNGLRVTRDEVRDLHERILRAKVAERRRMPGLEEQRAELVPAGSTFLLVAMELFGLEELTISDWALREGIVLDTLRVHDPADWSEDPRAIRRAAVAGLARRCSSDAAHTAQVTRLALDLFDQTTALHGLGADDRELLEYGARLHDIGQHVSRKGHQRHAAYLVENAQLRGFAPDEVQRLAALVRHHRKGDPKPGEPRYAALSDAERERIRRLAALLRIADGLDRGRRAVVESLDVDVGPHLVVLRIRACDDAELALWGARRRRELFERVYDRELEVTVAEAVTPVPAAPGS
jgi:exopolyphosphatase/guanosine-5'-triphosphate,3'-diphosphate pyrophosphatase